MNCGKCGLQITGEVKQWSGSPVCERCYEKLLHGGEYPASRASERANDGGSRDNPLKGTAMGFETVLPGKE